MATLWIPGPLPGMNELIEAAKGARGRGHRYSRLKLVWNDTIVLLARAARIPTMKRAHLAFRWLERDKRRDPDNIAGGGRKIVLDGLVTAGVLENDGWAQVAGWTDSFDVAARAGVEVTISEA